METQGKGSGLSHEGKWRTAAAAAGRLELGAQGDEGLDVAHAHCRVQRPRVFERSSAQTARVPVRQFQCTEHWNVRVGVPVSPGGGLGE